MEFTWADAGSGVKEPEGKSMKPPDLTGPPRRVMGRRQLNAAGITGIGVGAGGEAGVGPGWGESTMAGGVEGDVEAFCASGAAAAHAQTRPTRTTPVHFTPMQRVRSARRYS